MIEAYFFLRNHKAISILSIVVSWHQLGKEYLQCLIPQSLAFFAFLGDV